MHAYIATGGQFSRLRYVGTIKCPQVGFYFPGFISRSLKLQLKQADKISLPFRDLKMMWIQT